MMVCFSLLFFLTVWADEMYSRVDLGSWISCVHQFKLRAHFTSIHQDVIHLLDLLVCWCQLLLPLV